MTPEQNIAMAIGFLIFAAVATLWTYQRHKTKLILEERSRRGY